MARDDIEISRAPLSRHEQDEAAVVASRAFQHDPFFDHLWPKHLVRSRGLALFFRSVITNNGPGGQVLTARQGDKILGVAVWIEPGGYPFSLPVQARQMLDGMRAMLGHPRRIPDGLRYLLAMEHHHHVGPHWYLELLVTDPSVQRSGIGTMLLAETIDRCDTEGVPAYLETQNEDNLAYYARFGFDVSEKMTPTKTGPPLWTLTRPYKG